MAFRIRCYLAKNGQPKKQCTRNEKEKKKKKKKMKKKKRKAEQPRRNNEPKNENQYYQNDMSLNGTLTISRLRSNQ